MYITLMMDVEDLVSPDADDAALDCAEILTDEGLAATMCVVGQKARLLRQRGRADVIRALGKHDIGLHTDMHSVHPTIIEYLWDKGWDDGVAEAVRREQPGAKAIRSVFGVDPSCWGGPGNTWGPQICGALEKMGIPAFVYSHTSVPGGDVHRFGGVLAYPGGRALSDGSYHDDAAASAKLSKLLEDLKEDRRAGLIWREVFVGHPTRIMHEDFWDKNFFRGAQPPREKWVSAPRKSDADYRRALVNFRAAARALRETPGVEVATIRQMNERVSRLPASDLTPEQAERAWAALESALRSMPGWPPIREGLDVNRMVGVAREKLGTLQRLDLSAARQA